MAAYYLDMGENVAKKRVQISTGTRLIASPCTVASAIFARTTTTIIGNETFSSLRLHFPKPRKPHVPPV